MLRRKGSPTSALGICAVALLLVATRTSAAPFVQVTGIYQDHAKNRVIVKPAQIASIEVKCGENYPRSPLASKANVDSAVAAMREILDEGNTRGFVDPRLAVHILTYDKTKPDLVGDAVLSQKDARKALAIATLDVGQPSSVQGSESVVVVWLKAKTGASWYPTVVTLTDGKISEITVNEVEGVPVRWDLRGCTL